MTFMHIQIWSKILFQVVVLLSLVYASSCATKNDSTTKPVTVSWEQAVALILEGNIEGVFQDHSKRVWMRSKDGREYQTREPHLDAVWPLIDKVDPDRQFIKRSTE